MSHSHHVNQFLVDPNLAYQPHPGLPPPPGMPFEGTHPLMPMGPPAVLVDNVVEILKPLQEEVERVGKVLTDISDTTFDTSETVHELSERMKSLEIAVKKKLDLKGQVEAHVQGAPKQQQVLHYPSLHS
ncbi:hypothetical protein RSOL_305030, partial [Rhizoctonia solani AG-3 Rhs1AP]